MSTNVTIRMDDKLLREVKHRAVDQNMSTSRWIAKVLEGVTEADRGKEAARRRALRRLDHGFHLGGACLNREQVHER